MWKKIYIVLVCTNYILFFTLLVLFEKEKFHSRHQTGLVQFITQYSNNISKLVQACLMARSIHFFLESDSKSKKRIHNQNILTRCFRPAEMTVICLFFSIMYSNQLLSSSTAAAAPLSTYSCLYGRNICQFHFLQRKLYKVHISPFDDPQ